MTPDVDLSGYAEVRALYQLDVEGTPWQTVERVRPMFQIRTGPRVSATGVVEGTLVQGRDSSKELLSFLQDSEVGPTLEEYCTPTENYAFDNIRDYLTVERLFVDFEGETVDIRVGRQAVNWGSALVFHPTDIVNEVIASEPWKERRGVNAVRANIGLGEHSIVALATMDDDLSAFEKAEIFPEYDALPVSVATKATLRALETDFSAVANYRPDGDYFVGGDLRGTLGVGWWVEGGWRGLAEAPEVVAGIDYSFPIGDRFFVAAEYRYDGTGEPNADEYDYSLRGGSAIDSPYDCPFPTLGGDQGEDAPKPRTTLGQHYVDGTISTAFLNDYGATVTAIVNAQDGTGLIIPDVSAKFGERWQLHVGAQIPVGDEGEFKPPNELFVLAAGDKSANLSGFIPAATLNTWVRYSF